MKLYTYDSAPNPARLKMFLDYKDIHIDTQQVDMVKAEHQSEQYLALVPEGTVPALLLEDGTRFTEVIAIVHYLELLYPERPLLGVTPVEKALILNWNHRLFNGCMMAIAEVFRNTHPAYKDKGLPGPHPHAQIPELADRGRDRLTQSFQQLDGELASRPWVAGNSFSFADIDLLAAITFAKWGARMQPDESLGHLAAWRSRATEKLHSRS